MEWGSGAYGEILGILIVIGVFGYIFIYFPFFKCGLKDYDWSIKANRKGSFKLPELMYSVNYNLERQRYLEQLFRYNIEEGEKLLGRKYYHLYNNNGLNKEQRAEAVKRAIDQAVRQMARREGWDYHDPDVAVAKAALNDPELVKTMPNSLRLEYQWKIESLDRKNHMEAFTFGE